MKKLLIAILALTPVVSFASTSDCSEQIVGKFKEAREMYVKHHEELTTKGFAYAPAKKWLKEVKELEHSCKDNNGILLPYDRTIQASDLENLMIAYIRESGIEEWQAKFTLADVCSNSPKACGLPYKRSLADPETQVILGNIIMAIPG